MSGYVVSHFKSRHHSSVSTLLCHAQCAALYRSSLSDPWPPFSAPLVIEFQSPTVSAVLRVLGELTVFTWVFQFFGRDWAETRTLLEDRCAKTSTGPAATSQPKQLTETSYKYICTRSDISSQPSFICKPGISAMFRRKWAIGA
jgi:hypothetical protein